MSKTIEHFTDIWFDLYTGQQTTDDQGDQRVIILTKRSYKITNPDGYKRIENGILKEMIRQLKKAVEESNNDLDFLNS